MAKDTLKTLGDRLKHNEEKLGRAESERDRERTNRVSFETKIKEVTQQFDDLKARLHAAETSNQFMRGYLARVQEDDTVREELVTIGEPEGEQRMVPKRKPTHFERPSDFTEPPHNIGGMDGYLERHREDRKPRHWITY